MEITSAGLGLSLDAHITAALDIMRYGARKRRQAPREEESIASILFGGSSSREAIFSYRHRLISMLDQLDLLDEIPEDLPELRPRWTREPHARVGAVVFTVPPGLEPPRIWTPPAQHAQTARFLEQYRTVANLGPPVEVHRARIVLGQGTERVDTDMADAVEVTSAGLQALQNPELPVMVTRMPPRFPTRLQMLKHLPRAS